MTDDESPTEPPSWFTFCLGMAVGSIATSMLIAICHHFVRAQQ